MSLTESTMLALGTKAPEFSLPNVVDGTMVGLKDFGGKKALLVIFLCRHCPYVQHVKQGLKDLSDDFLDRNVGVVGIASNDVDNYPEDNMEGMAGLVEEMGYTFPVLLDESQAVAKAFTAACTPDFFLFDADLKLVYRGQMDDSRPGNGKPVTGSDVRAAIEAVLAGKPVSELQRPASGCNIKWKRGHEPEYFV